VPAIANCLSPRPLNAIIDFGVAGLDGKFARAKSDRPLDIPIARIDIPTPKARLDLLNVIRDCSV
jgi:hypothetical protein